MPYEFYKVLHVLSVLLIFIGLASYLYSGKKTFAILHGFGLIVLLVTGFGLAARLGIVSGLPLWIWIKLSVWVLVGAAMMFVKRKILQPQLQITLWMLLAAIAIYAAIYKPQFA